MKDKIQLKKHASGITMQCHVEGGSYQHYEFANGPELVKFAREQFNECKAIIARLNGVVLTEEHTDQVILASIFSDTVELILDFVDLHYPETAWERQLVEAVDAALAEGTA
jgi:hypothetical protein